MNDLIGKVVYFLLSATEVRPAIVVAADEKGYTLNVQYAGSRDVPHTGHGGCAQTVYDIQMGEQEGQFSLSNPLLHAPETESPKTPPPENKSPQTADAGSEPKDTPQQGVDAAPQTTEPAEAAEDGGNKKEPEPAAGQPGGGFPKPAA